MRSIVRGLKFERNEFHVFNRVIRQIEICRYCCCSVSVTWVICGLSVFGESVNSYSPSTKNYCFTYGATNLSLLCKLNGIQIFP